MKNEIIDPTNKEKCLCKKTEKDSDYWFDENTPVFDIDSTNCPVHSPSQDKCNCSPKGTFCSRHDSPSQSEWKKEFDKLNVYNEKYEPILGCCGGNYCIGRHDERLKSFIQKVSESSKEEGRKEGYDKGEDDGREDQARMSAKSYIARRERDKEKTIQETESRILKLIEGEKRTLARCVRGSDICCVSCDSGLTNCEYTEQDRSHNNALEKVIRLIRPQELNKE